MFITSNFSTQTVEFNCQVRPHQDISPLLEAVNKADFDAFVKIIDNFDLNQYYNHKEFPEKQLLSKFLLFRFLGLVSNARDEFPADKYPNAEKFIKIVLERKPNLTNCYVNRNYSFIDFIKDLRQSYIETIAYLENSPEKDNTLNSSLLPAYKTKLSQIELIANYLHI